MLQLSHHPLYLGLHVCQQYAALWSPKPLQLRASIGDSIASLIVPAFLWRPAEINIRPDTEGVTSAWQRDFSHTHYM